MPSLVVASTETEDINNRGMTVWSTPCTVSLESSLLELFRVLRSFQFEQILVVVVALQEVEVLLCTMYGDMMFHCECAFYRIEMIQILEERKKTQK